MTYYAQSTHKSKRRGYNRVITVYTQNKDKRFCYVDEIHVNTASYRGDDAIANQILHDKFNFKWADIGTRYHLKRKDIKVVWFPSN